MSKRAKLSGATSPNGKRKRLASAVNDQPRTLGAPRFHNSLGRYVTAGGLVVDCTQVEMEDPKAELEALVDTLDTNRGCLFESSYEFPGRYARWTMGFCDPPLMLEGWGRRFRIKALNARGKVLVPPIATCLRACPALLSLTESDGGDALSGTDGWAFILTISVTVVPCPSPPLASATIQLARPEEVRLCAACSCSV